MITRTLPGGCPLCGRDCRCGLAGLAAGLAAPSTLCNRCGNPSPSCTCRSIAVVVGFWLVMIVVTAVVATGGPTLAVVLADRTGQPALALLGPALAIAWLVVLLRLGRRRTGASR